ncbi:MAG: L-histidine N(alpha)-methyltransferase [Actinomycetota bacterium]|nr:L-histidine N(alpha)-methyltransferase [Actinomycetota bacterium]
MPDGLPATAPEPVVDVRYTAAERAAALRASAVAGLTATPKELSPQWFYDQRGSQLFDEITRLPEYYLTERERDILRARADELAELTEANTLVELGSGTSEKTRLLLDALAAAGHLRRFAPFDVSEATLRASAAAIVHEYPGIEVHGVVGDFERHLALLPEGRRRLIAFLGSTIGNLAPESRARFLSAVERTLAPGEGLLLGVDLVKDVPRLEAAYNDAAGVTAEFNRNILLVLNRELGADFEPTRFEHVARWYGEHERIEMLLRSTVDQSVRIAALRLEVRFAAGEEMRTELSCKFRRAGLEDELAAAGLELVRWWPHATGDFAVVLARA